MLREKEYYCTDDNAIVNDLKVSEKEDKLKRDNSSQKMNEPEKNRSLESKVVFQTEREGY